MQCGLLGEHLSHSFSPQIHAQLGSYQYKLYEVQAEKLNDFFNNEPFTGINVTIPYKKTVIQYCDKLTPAASLLGAVNTIVRQKDGSLLGHNSDYQGFRSMVERSKLNISGKKVLVLGSGGASATVVAVLNQLHANPIVISRNGDNNYNNLERHRDASVIVNTTPVGMYPNNGDSPLDIDQFPALEGVLDLIYNPRKTALLMSAEARGLITENGLWMLVAQAKESAEYFSSSPIDDQLIAKIYKQIERQTQNVILIGMPGCGKSTVGNILAQKTGRMFVDIDAEIEIEANMSIPEIFAHKGQASFREIESTMLEKFGKQSGLVIATGGGCVTVPKNYDYLRQNGQIIWMKRHIHMLPTEGRPLSNKETLQKLYDARAPLYESFSDVIVENNGSAESTVQTIIGVLSKGDI